MGHLSGHLTPYEDPPLVSESEKEMQKDVEPALRYLNKSNNMDLAEMLGLEPKGEN